MRFYIFLRRWNQDNIQVDINNQHYFIDCDSKEAKQFTMAPLEILPHSCIEVSHKYVMLRYPDAYDKLKEMEDEI